MSRPHPEKSTDADNVRFHGARVGQDDVVNLADLCTAAVARRVRSVATRDQLLHQALCRRRDRTPQSPSGRRPTHRQRVQTHRYPSNAQVSSRPLLPLLHPALSTQAAVGDVTSAEAYCVATSLNINRGSVYYLAWPVRRRISRPCLASYPERAGGFSGTRIRRGFKFPDSKNRNSAQCSSVGMHCSSAKLRISAA